MRRRTEGPRFPLESDITEQPFGSHTEFGRFDRYPVGSELAGEGPLARCEGTAGYGISVRSLKHPDSGLALLVDDILRHLSVVLCDLLQTSTDHVGMFIEIARIDVEVDERFQ